MDSDIKKALLGDHEAAKRLTEKGVLLSCCGKSPKLNCFMGLGAWSVECSVNGHIHNTALCDSEYDARLAWNARAAVEMEGMEDGTVSRNNA